MPDAPSPANRLKTTIAAAEIPTQGSLLTLAVGVVVIAALYFAREVLIPITLAILLSFVLAPLVDRLRRLHLWRVPAVLLAILLALSVIVTLGAIIGTQLAELGSRAPLYTYTIQQKVGSVSAYVATELSSISKRLGHATATVAPKPSPEPGEPAEEANRPIPVEVHQPEPTALETIERIVEPVLHPLGSVGIVLIVAVFILLNMEDLRDRMIRLFGSGDLHRTTVAMDDAAHRLSRYFLAQLSLNASFGIVIGLALWIIGVPSPALFGIIAALFRFVPYVGAVGAAILPVVLAAAVDPGWTMAVVTLAMFVVVEALCGHVVEPLLYGHSTGLSPVSVIIAAIFWTWLWGPVGLILSMPLTLCLVVLGRHVERLQFIDVLLGDRPALTPAESFYQRILSGDADEVLDQAETLLRDRPLAAYYDDVAMRGLQMAANDSIRGVLTDRQLDHIQDSIDAVVLDLADHKDAGAETIVPEQQVGGTVLCVAGRGPLDESACTMLAQVLARNGRAVRVVSQDATARGFVDRLDMTGVDVIVVSWLEASGSLSGLRYLVRRLRSRAQGHPIVVGTWHADAGLIDETRLKSVVSADHYTRSLQEAVAICAEQAPPAAASAPAELATT